MKLRDMINKYKSLIVLGSLILVAWAIKNPSAQVMIPTQSILGGTVAGIGIGLLLMIIGGILVVIPEPATTLIGAIMVFIGIATGGLSTIIGVVSFIDFIAENIWPVAIIAGVIFYFYLKRKTLFGRKR
jgi:hypothetical protein